ncbi:MAG: carboxypeptidase-like regulatory domain-containing protein [Chitinophagaceae bacterium]
MRSILVILFAVFFFLPAAKGQFYVPGEIGGRVTDSNGRGLDGVIIKLIQDGLLKNGSVSEDGGGDYAIKPILPGLYSLQITNPGYATLIIKGILIKSDKFANVSFKMVPGKIDSTVTAIYNFVQVRDRIGGSGVHKRDSGFVTIIPYSKMKTSGSFKKEFPFRLPVVYFGKPEFEVRDFFETQLLFEYLSVYRFTEISQIGCPAPLSKRGTLRIGGSQEWESVSPTPLVLSPHSLTD